MTAASDGFDTASGEGAEPDPVGVRMQIGEVAERVGLSLRTIRHYEDVGLVTPSSRSDGGFRLYTDADLTRLAVIKRMKPLGFSLEEMRELLRILDALSGTTGQDTNGPDDARLLDRLAVFHTVTKTRTQLLRDQLANAHAFGDTLKAELARRGRR